MINSLQLPKLALFPVHLMYGVINQVVKYLTTAVSSTDLLDRESMLYCLPIKVFVLRLDCQPILFRMHHVSYGVASTVGVVEFLQVVDHISILFNGSRIFLRISRNQMVDKENQIPWL